MKIDTAIISRTTPAMAATTATVAEPPPDPDASDADASADPDATKRVLANVRRRLEIHVV